MTPHAASAPPLASAPPAVAIRALRPDDAAELFELAMAQGSDLDGFAWRARLRSVQDEAAFIDWALGAESRREAFCRAIVVDGSLAGCASLYTAHPGSFPEGREPTLQMGYWVARAARGAGASWKAMRLLMDETAPLVGPAATVGIRTRSRNGASLACAARLGLAPQGVASPSMFDPTDDDLLLIGRLALLPAPPSARPKAKP